MALSCGSSKKTATVLQTGDIPSIYANTIKEAELKEHLYVYASDEFEGRDTGKPGQKKAVEYLTEQYTNLGVLAAKGNGDYFQKVPLLMDGNPRGVIKIDDREYGLGKDFVTFINLKASFDQLVYVGYGIEDGDYSNYEGVDVNGKLVLMKEGEPQNEDGTYLLTGTKEKSIWSNDAFDFLRERRKVAIAKGARGILYFNSTQYDNHAKRFNQEFEPFMYFPNTDDEEEIFVASLSATMAQALNPTIATEETATELDITVVVDTDSSHNIVETENVVAMIPGNTKPDEYIVLSAHLDHIGITKDGKINNGADDDGSGTVALLEIAEAFKEATTAGNGPERSIVFLHFTGEEQGMLGSEYYANNPVVPLAGTVANLNIDMIGRIDPKRKGERNYIYLIGSNRLSTELHTVSEKVNETYMGIELDYTYNKKNDPNEFYYRSDHYNFAKNNIPVIFYFNGTHDDYHKPSDTPDKINYDLLTNRTQLIFHTAWELANRENRISIDKSFKR